MREETKKLDKRGEGQCDLCNIGRLITGGLILGAGAYLAFHVASYHLYIGPDSPELLKRSISRYKENIGYLKSLKNAQRAYICRTRYGDKHKLTGSDTFTVIVKGRHGQKFPVVCKVPEPARSHRNKKL